MVDDLHRDAGVHATEVGHELVAEIAVIAQGAHDITEVTRAHDQLDGVAHGFDGHSQSITDLGASEARTSGVAPRAQAITSAYTDARVAATEAGAMLALKIKARE